MASRTKFIEAGRPGARPSGCRDVGLVQLPRRPRRPAIWSEDLADGHREPLQAAGSCVVEEGAREHVGLVTVNLKSPPETEAARAQSASRLSEPSPEGAGHEPAGLRRNPIGEWAGETPRRSSARRRT